MQKDIHLDRLGEINGKNNTKISKNREKARDKMEKIKNINNRRETTVYLVYLIIKTNMKHQRRLSFLVPKINLYKKQA